MKVEAFSARRTSNVSGGCVCVLVACGINKSNLLFAQYVLRTPAYRVLAHVLGVA